MNSKQFDELLSKDDGKYKILLTIKNLLQQVGKLESEVEELKHENSVLVTKVTYNKTLDELLAHNNKLKQELKEKNERIVNQSAHLKLLEKQQRNSKDAILLDKINNQKKRLAELQQQYDKVNRLLNFYKSKIYFTPEEEQQALNF